ncbi:HPP family protein [Coleofasciculus sp. FACHB-64]|uniref:HPP family protein n=1 Tax=Cyanophyceae TaxID=3028117 RepID=UPI001686FF34|nr:MULTISPECIES: HPP family protein [unclassified Coleofasciculus]MBD1840036.1 HPP family protein [Coleofasciculus sp. FACHB-501]MBD1900826.1 HPP family protein [Coleofasciculus sp. FACHB-125]MBD2044928.1 HPP family protein [Coleofasciculus sp. FACHB-64]
MRSYLPKGRNYRTILPQLNYKSIRLRVDNYCLKIRGSKRAVPLERPDHRHILWSSLGSFIGIAATAYLSVKTGAPLLMAPFGATSVLIFGVPDSPLAQPRNVIGGNFIAALVSLTILHLFGAEPWAMGMAVATAIGMMQFTGTLHPPSGAVALVVMMTKAQWQFLLTPALEGSIILVLCAVVFNNLAQDRTYPKHWF